MGVHSTFFGPVKYALLPQHLRDDELMKGNAMIEGATFLAILAGTIAGGALMTDGVPISVAAAVCPVIACVGLAASLFIPAAPPTTEERINDEKRGETPRQGTIALIRWGWSDGTSLFAMLGISWFCMIGAVFLGIFPTLVRDAIGGGEELVTALLALFSIFVGVGAMASARLAPAPALRPLVGAISIMAAALVGASAALPLAAAHGVAVPIEAMAFLGIPASWPFLSCVAIAAAAGGAFSVPLYTLLQTASDDATRARSIACNNVTNALFAAFGMAGTHGLLKLGASQTQAIAFLGLLALIAALAATGLARKLAPSLLRPGRRSEAPNAD
jgi:acyl-[acyl-carrier-protein]-phospholipid O-acyltransferase/long-chain-fatty-acid--[acyl-carrier-protein] ligase